MKKHPEPASTSKLMRIPRPTAASIATLAPITNISVSLASVQPRSVTADNDAVGGTNEKGPSAHGSAGPFSKRGSGGVLLSHVATT